ncbi:GDYXXLXY domain-containing protein [Brevibacillus ruminantium]|uniref:GDYXXLXY domain-containing protein n=1 Tax=Brevibacillus ruminantium TaxID=2950604 RepID=A0ABY4WDU4_9BACL|nr:GDYXXLXY domain-containing protein [Brevibacillus ruminantium]USG65011.1 GDYXXLXY domain-containing protein [Brevibacillus ruminantium]
MSRELKRLTMLSKGYSYIFFKWALVLHERVKYEGVTAVKLTAVRLGYFLALACLLSAIMYFFASNWPEMGRGEKIGVCVSVLFIFYLASYVGTLLWKRHIFLSNWLLVAGGLAFGICTALLGQVYNSHADSYMLFAVWFLPNALFAFFTRYQPFYVVSYVLAHLAIYFYLKPSATWIVFEEEFLFFAFLSIACVNALLFWLTSQGHLQSRPIHYLSFSVFHLVMFVSSFMGVYGAFPGLLYFIVLAASFLYFLRVRPHRGFLIATSAVGALFILGKFLWFIGENFSAVFLEGILFLGLLLAAGLVWGSVALLKWLRQGVGPHSSIWQRAFQEAMIVLVTVVASLIGTICIMFLLFLTYAGENVLYFIFFLSLAAFIAPAVFLQTTHETVRYTLLSMGYLMGAVSALFISLDGWMGIGYFWLFFLVILLLVWWRLPQVTARMLTQFTFLLVLFVQGEQLWGNHRAVTLLLIGVFQLAMYFVPRLHPLLQKSALIYGMASLLMLAETLQGGYYFAANLAFFLMSTGLLFWTHSKRGKWDFGIVLLFWFGFLVSKYYDLLWSLLHKSVSLFALSILFFVLGYWFDRRLPVPSRAKEREIFSIKRYPLLLIILLQFGLIGYQVWGSETILAKGKTVKLELAPIDPRSLLQGDYVSLNYEISRIDEIEDGPSYGRVRVVLRKQSNGVHAYSGYYQYAGEWNQPYQATPDDVVINGQVIGWGRVAYGIENFFVPEGTGLDVERSARYAYVRVGESGDAIIERLAEQ